MSIDFLDCCVTQLSRASNILSSLPQINHLLQFLLKYFFKMLPSRSEKGSIRIAKDMQDQNCRNNPMRELPIWELPNVRTIRVWTNHVGTSNYPCGNLQRRGRGNCISPAHCKGSLLPIVTNCCPPIVLLWPSTPPAKPLVAPQAQPFQGGGTHLPSHRLFGKLTFNACLINF